MPEAIRFGVSISDELLKKFDQLIARKGHANRSEAIRDLIRDSLVRQEWDENAEIVGTIALVYEHHARELASYLTEFQHEDRSSVLSTLHIHLDEDNCLEVIVVRGRSSRIKKLSDRLIGLKGVKHGNLIMSTTGEKVPR